MRIIECDRCHKRFKRDAKKTGYVNLDQRDIKTGGLEGNSEFDDWDICPDCMEKIRDFVRMVPPKEEKPKATIKKMPVQGKTITKPDWIRRLAGVLTGANFDFVIAGLFGGNHDEDLPDQ